MNRSRSGIASGTVDAGAGTDPPTTRAMMPENSGQGVQLGLAERHGLVNSPAGNTGAGRALARNLRAAKRIGGKRVAPNGSETERCRAVVKRLDVVRRTMSRSRSALPDTHPEALSWSCLNIARRAGSMRDRRASRNGRVAPVPTIPTPAIRFGIPRYLGLMESYSHRWQETQIVQFLIDFT